MGSKDMALAFFGASGGCGLFALKKAVAGGYTCLALCRTPAKLDEHFPQRPANLHVIQGNAHCVEDVGKCLSWEGGMVDAVYFTIGGKFDVRSMSIDDPDVCRRGITALYEALASVRQSLPEEEGGGGRKAKTQRPLVVVGSTTGVSKHKRDVPLLMVPMYSFMLKQPHQDKRAMEEIVMAGPERYVLVRPSLLMDGEKPGRKIRVALEDPEQGVERVENGYAISREDVGRWVFENLLMGGSAPNQYEGKAVGLTW